MNVMSLPLASVVAAVRDMWRRRLPARSRPLTLLEAPSAEAVVVLVRRVARRGDGAEEIVARLSRLYARFLPDEPTLRRLSFFHQLHAGRCDETAFCCTTVFAIAQEERARAVCRDRAPSRVRSAPPSPTSGTPRGCAMRAFVPSKPSRCRAVFRRSLSTR